MAKDFLGDEMPAGYKPWYCTSCEAVCNFEAMMQCSQRPTGMACGFDRDQPESNGSIFGFMIVEKS